MADSRLQEQLENLQNIDIIAALWPAGLLIKESAVDIVPVDTGRLQASITVEELSPDEHGIMVFAGAGEYDVTYATIVEFGNSNPNYPIQPYMRPAIDNNTETIPAVLRLEIERQLRELIA